MGIFCRYIINGHTCKTVSSPHPSDQLLHVQKCGYLNQLPIPGTNGLKHGFDV